GRHAVELYVRTYTTMLQSSGWIRLEALQQAHIGMESTLHPLAAQPEVDMGALIYAVRRLPAAIAGCRRVVLGQSSQAIRQELGADVLSWQKVEAPARRRRWYYDGKETIAALIASPSDIDDLIPTLVAYQLEWNKLHRTLHGITVGEERQAAGASEDDWTRLQQAWTIGFEHIESGETHASRDNWLYFAARGFFDSHPKSADFRKVRSQIEREMGIRHIRARAGVAESAAQIFKLADLDPSCFDPRVGRTDPLRLKASAASIINVDYPPGLASYHPLREICEQVHRVTGVYVMGKAATLNADVGDVLISNAVYNEHSGDTYWLDNCF